MLASSACRRLMRNGEAASTAPAPTVVSRRRREIDPDFLMLLPSVMLPPLNFLFWFDGSNPSQGRQDNLRRQRNLGNYRAKRPERVIDRIGHRRGGPRRTGLARALGAQLGLKRRRHHVADIYIGHFA